MYEVTVAVVTYNNAKEKLLLTLNSVLKQKSIKYQIVIADDGSQTKDFTEIRKYFYDRNFDDYKIVENPVNQGTVKNLLSAVEVSNGLYVKVLSPGDLLYAETTLRCWIDDMKKKEAKVGFGYTVSYRENGNTIQAVATKAFPQDTGVYAGESRERFLKEQYLICGDLCIGASTIATTDIELKYLKLIVDKVRYAEDNIFRLMIAEDIKVSFFHENVILYEYGDGISTSNNSKWAKRINDDWEAATKIIIERCQDSNASSCNIKYYFSEIKDGTKAKKIFYYIRNPKLLLFKIKIRFFTKKTATNISDQYYQECKNGIV